MLKRWAAMSLVTFAAVAIPTAPASAATVTVDTSLDSYDGSCSDADCSFRDAIASAGVGGTVIVPSGSYVLDVPEAGGPGDGSVVISDLIYVRAEPGAFLIATDLGSTPLVARASVQIFGLTIFGTSTDDRAGILEQRGGSVAMHDVTLTGGRGRLAGAVFVAGGGRLRLFTSLVLENRSPHGAGGVKVGDGALTARRSTFLGNIGERGGAIAGSIDHLVNATLAENAARTSGGAIRTEGVSHWQHVTITGNRAGTGGAWSRSGPAGHGDPLVDHTIIDGNRSDRGGQCDGRVASLGYNLQSGTGCGFTLATDQTGVDPRVGATGSHGGPTPTAALRAASPALNVGGNCPGRDQRGAPRDGRCDAGAYERVLCRGRAVDIVGTPRADELSGGRERDTFLGLGGDDEFQGSLDRDRACGGAGDDHLLGGPGDDILSGGPGEDELDGEDGADRCIGGRGRDRLISCGSGRSTA
jgi:hypothetical protein